MPVNGNLKMAGPGEYAQRRLGDSFAPPPAVKRSSTPQPQQARSHQRANEAIERQPRSKSRDATGHEGISIRQAASLKLPVKNTLTTGPKPLREQALQQNNPTAASAAQHKKSFGGPNIQTHREPQISAFDDTQSIHLDESTSIVGDQDFRSDFQFKPASRNQPPTYQPQFHSKQPLGQLLAHDWQAEADGERERRGEPPKFRKSVQHNNAESVYNNEQSDDGYEPDGEYYPEEEGPELNDTPSRTRMVTEGHPEAVAPLQLVKQEAQHVVPAEPQLKLPFGENQQPVHLKPLAHQPRSRFQTGKQVQTDGPERQADIMQRPIPGADLQHLQTTQPPPFSSKVSSYHESSSEEEHALHADKPQLQASPEPGHPSKRQREDQDLDFDMATLKTKSMSDLDNIPFTVDPRLPAPEAAVDATGTPMTLAAKLTNLTKMRPDDQRQLFQSLTDAEREQTADWFLEKFQADVQRLMDVRLERRKIALGYDLEVKKREKSVQTKMHDVGEELAVLRKGGGELIARKGQRNTTDN
ncbi:hypothetical protein LTR10_022477 [Elasticomyces elasticus]|uniref:Extracellular mutant protein 11 C-terminal domain-containing protein n=1 Tax=Exophiala sideris TaxID=1016849 RepID=A0ABR0J157_9EURO|nr:hypothetical protein LTR10_022477 [Elasticomyces elasticus]KAK5024383.1 hypothetical protein LTS07_008674 [Exophiala sideris]KAK5030935.1 hypothetical protein LTR13_007948 [Exophiala sideris]KAK5054116.1 hypothetical protein LTR69_009078 [Exophiala sideris]KAK5179528.1 hypothetical protein LTR44_008044 [Eurotiomycetes sp. CCFEE 6388]